MLFHVVILMGSGAGDAAATGAAAAKARAAGGASAANAAAGKDKERLVGVARLNLLDVLERGSDLTSLPPLPLFNKLVGSQPLTNAAAAAASSAAAAAAAAAAAPVAKAQAAAAASATAVAAAEKGGQLGTLAVNTHLIHALRIAQRQLKARNSHVTLRAAPTIPPITSAAAAAAAASCSATSPGGAPPALRRSSSTTSSSPAFQPQPPPPYGGAFPSFDATGTGPSTGGGIRGSGGFGGSAAGQSHALRQASLAAGVSSSVGGGGVAFRGGGGDGTARLRQSAPSLAPAPPQGGLGMDRPPAHASAAFAPPPMQRSSSYRAELMQEEAVSTSQGLPAQQQQRPSRFPQHVGPGHTMSSSGGGLPGLSASGGSVGTNTRHAGIVGDLEDDEW